jgi:SAM-dependent methyltransferase
MPAALSRTELMGRVLAAVPGQRDYLAPHHERFHLAYSLLREHLPPGLRSAVDVGASHGIFLPVLDALGLAELHAVDFGEVPASRPLALRVGERTLAATHHELDIERDRFPFADQALDLAIFMEVLEHLPVDPMHTLLELNRILRPGGVALITTPNACSAESLVRLLRGQHPGHFPPLRNRSDQRHHREYAPTDVVTLVERAGFAVQWTKTLPAGRATVRWLVRVLRWFGKARIADDRLGEIVYVFAKKERAVDRAAMPVADRYPAPVYMRDP